ECGRGGDARDAAARRVEHVLRSPDQRRRRQCRADASQVGGGVRGARARNHLGFRLPPARREGTSAARRSTFTRLVGLAMLLSLLLVAGLWALTDQTIRATVAGSARKAVDVDLAGLVDIYATGGRAELERRIHDRLAITPSDGSVPHYLLADAD